MYSHRTAKITRFQTRPGREPQGPDAGSVKAHVAWKPASGTALRLMKLAGARFEKADSALGQALWDQLDPGQTEDTASRISQLQRDHADSADAYLTTIRHVIAKAEKHPAALEKIFDHVGQGLQGSTTA